MSSQRTIIASVTVFLTATAAIMILAVVGAAMTMNAQTLTRQTALLNNGLAGRVQEINHQAVAQLVWDDAVVHLDNQFDPEWAKANVGAYLATTDGFDGATVLDSGDHPIYAMRAGLDVDAATFGKPSAAAGRLIAWVRRAEARRQATSVQDWPRLMKTPIQASAFTKVDGRLQLVTATLVQPDFGHATLKAPHAPIVVTVRDLDDAFVGALGERFLLKDLHIAAPGEAGGVPLSGPEGEALARLTWTPDRPGDDVLRYGLPVVAVFLVAMAGVAWALMRRAGQAARSLIASEAKASHLALHDCATELPNQRLFDDRLAQALTQARRARRPMSVLLIGIDRFQDGVDRLSQQAGDEWAIQIAARLGAARRESETLARLGAEQFAVIQADGSAAAASALAERILAALKAPMRLTSARLQLSGSIGAAVAMDDAITSAELMRQAGLAQLRARELGGDQICFFEPEMDAAQRLRRELESDLRQALIEDALEVHYQPQVDGAGVIIGLEALARWTHPKRGVISPSIFVQIAEESGLIGPLGLFTLKRAFEDSVRWRDLRVAVNMTARQVGLPGLVDDVRALLTKFDVAGSRFELEINEAVLLENNEHIDAVLKRLKALGLTVALDNFGSGPTRLSQLRRYPIDKLKLDRSFVATLGINPEADGVVAALVKLARAFDFDVMAEGVETHDQRRRLTEAGCPKAQGFLFSRALTADAMQAFIQACPTADVEVARTTPPPRSAR
jgi:diguanylate cyclase (GGDEF)-like protein